MFSDETDVAILPRPRPEAGNTNWGRLGRIDMEARPVVSSGVFDMEVWSAVSSGTFDVEARSAVGPSALNVEARIGLVFLVSLPLASYWTQTPPEGGGAYNAIR